MYYKPPVTEIIKYGNLELPNFKMAK